MKRLLLTISLCLLLASTVALGDWKLGDDYKMHFPQLPDPDGWDVKATTIHNPDYNPDDPTSEPYLQHKVVADDWYCIESGPVADVHFWGSWRQDRVSPIDSIHLSIHADVPAGSDPLFPWSHPGELLWEQDITNFTVLEGFTGEQGWYNPNTGEATWPDHFMFHQINIENIPDPFIQEEGTIYWLDVQVDVPYLPPADGLGGLDPNQPEWGWKTSQQHWNDDAVFSDNGQDWFELYDPIKTPPQSLDMAFVITPEPATVALLGLGSLTLLRKRRA